MTTIEIAQEFFGEELTVSSAQFIADAPLDHLMGLFERLAPFYYDWLESEEKRRTDEAVEIYHCVDPYPAELPWREQLDRYKGLLLYFPHVSLPDPVASVIWPMATCAALMQELGELPIVSIPDEGKLRLELKAALSILAELSPLVNVGEISLIPTPFALDYQIVQKSARQELKSLSLKQN